MYTPLRIIEDVNKSKFPMVEPKKNANTKKKEEPKRTSSTKDKEITDGFKLNLSNMIDGGSVIAEDPSNAPKQAKKKSSSTKRKKNEVEVSMAKNNSDIEYEEQRPLNDFETNTPYMEKFQETNDILKGAIVQLEYGIQEMQKDANDIRASRTIRKKYDYLSEIQGTMGNFIGNKISAARELNNTINKCNDMELKRYKELKLSMNEKDDDKALMEAYQAFVNMPTNSSAYMPIGPSSLDLTLNNPNLTQIETGTPGGYDNYINNMTPQQHMMALESNPDVKQVVVYNEKTGQRYFEVMNIRTGEVIPNTDKMDIMLIDEFELDLKNKVARSINMNITMPLIIIGDPTLNEY